MNTKKNQNPKDANVYLIGSGISSLASAFYLEKDCRKKYCVWKPGDFL